MADRSGIVLAGGRSTRFGRDKLVEPVGGRPLLHHALERLAEVCSELIVVAGADAVEPPLPPDLPVRVVRDARPDEGPLAGLAAGLEAAHGHLAFVVGGDMPDLQSRVLLAMLRRAEADDVDAVALGDEGRWRPLPLLVRVGPASAAATTLLGSGRRRLRDLTEVLRLGVVEERDWRALDPDGRTLVDVDEPADLDR